MTNTRTFPFFSSIFLFLIKFWQLPAHFHHFLRYWMFFGRFFIKLKITRTFPVVSSIFLIFDQILPFSSVFHSFLIKIDYYQHVSTTFIPYCHFSVQIWPSPALFHSFHPIFLFLIKFEFFTFSSVFHQFLSFLIIPLFNLIIHKTAN